MKLQSRLGRRRLFETLFAGRADERHTLDVNAAHGRPAAGVVSADWTRLDASRLELGATGFVICLQAEPQTATYLLQDPEGRPLGFGTDLQCLKRYGEQMARDRLE